jgi:hypothetical protein
LSRASAKVWVGFQQEEMVNKVPMMYWKANLSGIKASAHTAFSEDAK